MAKAPFNPSPTPAEILLAEIRDRYYALEHIPQPLRWSKPRPDYLILEAEIAALSQRYKELTP